jgi:phosphate transport system protein
LRQPMAGDLRLIIGSMKIARDIERIGDYAANLAKRARTLNGQETIGLTHSLLQMASLVQPLIRSAMDAYSCQDISLADATLHQDDAVDTAYKVLITDLMQYMASHGEDVVICTNLLFMSKNLERIGDRATNVAENVHFIVDGVLPRATREKKTSIH